MQGDTTPHGYDLLAHLRRLETRIARLQKRWQSFRADPRPEQLEDFRVAFAGTDRALRELAAHLGGPPGPAAGGPPHPGLAGSGAAEGAASAGPQRPLAGVFGTDARSVVEAGRTLDQALAEVSRAWGFLRREPDPEGLGGLADRLARAEGAASVLGRALPRDEWAELMAGPEAPPGQAAPGPEPPPGDGPDERTDDDTSADGAANSDPTSETPAAGYAGADPGAPAAAGAHTPAEAHAAARAEAAGSLDALLTRIRDDWQHLRRRPAADRAGVLRGELGEARRMAEALRNRLLTAGPPDPATARYMTGMDDSVRFAPYRDAFTGLYNREGFDALAGAELKRCRRYDRSFGLLLIETQPSDLAELRGTIGQLQSMIRGYDLVSRYADRQLAVGLPEADGAETRRIAARLLRAIEEAGGGRTPVRRLAYALMPEDGASLAALVEAADRRLNNGTDG